MILIICIRFYQLIILQILFKKFLYLRRMNHELVEQQLILLDLSYRENLEENLLRALWHVYRVHLWPRWVSNVFLLFWKMKVFAIIHSVVNLVGSLWRLDLGARNVYLESWVERSLLHRVFQSESCVLSLWVLALESDDCLHVLHFTEYLVLFLLICDVNVFSSLNFVTETLEKGLSGVRRLTWFCDLSRFKKS